MSYDTNIVKKGFYFDFELLASFYNCKHSEITFLGHSSTGNNIYSTPKGVRAVVSKGCDYNIETGKGSFKFRPYKGSVEKLNKRNVEAHNNEKVEFLQLLKEEGSQLRIPDIKSFKTLPHAIAGYCSVIANSFGCSKEQHDQIMEYKKEMHEWIEREGYVR
jgi:hypothetical protein